MKNLKSRLKKTICMVLSAMLFVTVLPSQVFAEENTAPAPEIFKGTVEVEGKEIEVIVTITQETAAPAEEGTLPVPYDVAPVTGPEESALPVPADVAPATEPEEGALPVPADVAIIQKLSGGSVRRDFIFCANGRNWRGPISRWNISIIWKNSCVTKHTAAV